MIQTDRQYLSIAEAAACTGLSESTIRRRLDDGTLPGVQLGGRKTKWLIPIDALVHQSPSPVLDAPIERGDLCQSPPPPRRLPGPLPGWKRGGFVSSN